MDFILQKSELADLAEKVEANTRLEADDALRLFRTPDLNA
ncbi:MAG TPA: aminofutalosine synthase MqnE, partial [Verrucomicrobiales bacterium]|nr:aminofutalosine synthase MqnE [Verrucomicrobiales bacterium]